MTQTPSSGTFSNPSYQSSSDGNGIVDKTQQKAGQVVDQAQHAAGMVTEQAKEKATTQLESQKDRAVDALVTVAQALRQTGQHMHEHEQPGMAGYVEQAAERVEGLTNHLRARDVSQLLSDTEDLARRKPGMFLGAAAALGFLGARFLMSSGRRARSGSSYGQSSYGQPSFGQPGYGYGGPTSPNVQPGGYGQAGSYGQAGGYGQSAGYGTGPRSLAGQGSAYDAFDSEGVSAGGAEPTTGGTAI